MMPEIPEFALSSDVPDCELESLVVDFLNIESNCWDGCGIFMELHLVKDCSLTGSIKTQHKNLGFHVGERIEQFEDVLTHFLLCYLREMIVIFIAFIL